MFAKKKRTVAASRHKWCHLPKPSGTPAADEHLLHVSPITLYKTSAFNYTLDSRPAKNLTHIKSTPIKKFLGRLSPRRP